MAERLFTHLFPGDNDEHGAVLAAGIAYGSRGIRLLGRELFLAKDGKEYVRGERGYRMLTGGFVTEKILHCRDEGLCYLAIHNHGGTDAVGFSSTDMESHERGYPALLKIARGRPLGAVVFAHNAAAGDIWFSPSRRVPLTEARIVGPSIRRLYPAPPLRLRGRTQTYDRQARLFGDSGQDLLAGTKVGVIGAGGGGSLLIEYLRTWV
jgi:hypothetical protein